MSKIIVLVPKGLGERPGEWEGTPRKSFLLSKVRGSFCGWARAVLANLHTLVSAGSYYLTTTYGALEHIKNYDKITVTRQLSVEVQDSIHRWERRRTLNKARASRSSVQVTPGTGDGRRPCPHTIPTARGGDQAHTPSQLPGEE